MENCTLLRSNKDVSGRVAFQNYILENNLAIPQKLNIELLYDPAVLLGICPRERKTYICTETCTQMTIEILFIKDKKWKQAQMSVN